MNEIAPVLVSRCLGCHGPEKTRGGYRVDTFSRLLQPGGSKDPAVTPADPAASSIYRLIASPDPDQRMPKKGEPLPPDQITAIRTWIEHGAQFDGPDPAASLSAYVPGTAHPDAPAVYRRPVPITAIAFSPDGRTIAVGGYNEVTLWDTRTSALVGRVGGIPRQTQGLAWSPDGAWIAVAGGEPGVAGELRLIDPAGQSPSQLLARSADVQLCVRFSPDGRRLASGGADNAIRLFDLTDTGDNAAGARVPAKAGGVIEQHADWVTDLAFSPDGRHLATASRDKTCRVFDANTGATESAYVEQHSDAVFAIAWSADGKQIYSAGRDRKVHYWTAADGLPYKPPAPAPPKPALAVTTTKPSSTTSPTSAATTKPATRPATKPAVAATPPKPPPPPTPPTLPSDILRLAITGPRLFLACSDGQLRRYHPLTFAPQTEYAPLPDSAYALAVNERTGQIAAGSFNGEVRIWSMETGKVQTTFIAAPGYGK